MEVTPAVPPQTDIPVESASFATGITDAVEQLRQGEVPAPVVGLLVNSGLALLTVIVTYFIASFLSRTISAAICKRIDMTLGRFSGKVAFYGVWILALSFLLPRIGLEVAGLTAVLAAAGFAIGLSFQGTLSNFAAGMILLAFRPFKAGDLVMIAGNMGKIYEIDLFTTVLDTLDNRRLVIPNSSITGGIIENMTHHPHRRVDVTVSIAYTASLDETRAVLTQTAESLRELMIEGEDRGYKIVLTSLAPNAVEWTVRFWAKREDFFLVREKLTTEIKRHLDNNKIGIQIPQMQLHIAPPPIQEESVEEELISAQAFPIPNMPNYPSAPRGGRIRPRVRGENEIR
jgi:small conductance mechanosensitive channel